jgi:hypothetical protein
MRAKDLRGVTLVHPPLRDPGSGTRAATRNGMVERAPGVVRGHVLAERARIGATIERRLAAERHLLSPLRYRFRQRSC